MSTPEIITVNSEALEDQIRNLLPSQNGFGSELQASNVIMPIIDLTATAEGSGLGNSLQQAISIDGTRFSSATTSADQVVSTTVGFVRCFGTIRYLSVNTGSTAINPLLYLYDGSTKYFVYDLPTLVSASVQNVNTIDFDFIYFAGSGTSLRYDGATSAALACSTRQLASTSGTLINPTGFVAE
tara:strand:+ start:216 stop:767 length:552 start_codon:yes stop_codon:yes gene_type:complete